LGGPRTGRVGGDPSEMNLRVPRTDR
jgi:hypothetical protein